MGLTIGKIIGFLIVIILSIFTYVKNIKNELN